MWNLYRRKHGDPIGSLFATGSYRYKVEATVLSWYTAQTTIMHRDDMATVYRTPWGYLELIEEDVPE